jgi:LytS/YehU family sensor histidine kinase
MGLTWAAGWALVGLLIGVISGLLPGLPWDRFFAVFDAPLPALAIPGFVGGVLFSVVLGIAARRRRFEELSLARFAVLGAFGGLLLSLVPAALEAAGLLSGARPDGELWRLTATISVPFMLLSAVSAAATLALARKASRNSSESTGGAAAGGLIGGEGWELLGGTDPLRGNPAATRSANASRLPPRDPPRGGS